MLKLNILQIWPETPIPAPTPKKLGYVLGFDP